MSDSDDDSPQLSAHTLAALQEFYTEQKEQEDRLQTAQESGDVKNIALGEDWGLSQFWYSDETALRLAEEALNVAGENGRIACVSAPTAYKKIKELNQSKGQVKCLEYDERFKVFGEDFQFYDYKEPLNLPLDMKQAFDIVIADPPFLSEECLCKTAVTVKYLAKEKIVLCTGAIMEEIAYKLLGVSPCKFQPKHNSQLQNEFKCYTNYDSDFLSRS